jgi:hypothetical protein
MMRGTYNFKINSIAIGYSKYIAFSTVNVISEIKISSLLSVQFCRLNLLNFISKVTSLESKHLTWHRAARLGFGKIVRD